MNDQATQLRRLVEGGVGNGALAAPPAPVPNGRSRRHAPAPRRAPSGPGGAAPGTSRLARAVAVTSGKGGVGKTNIAVNLAVAWARLGQRVCLIDGDLGLANADVLCSLTPRLTLEHVVTGRCRLAEAMMLAPGGFRLIPGACGVEMLADLAGAARRGLLAQLGALERVADCVVIDTAAGLSRNVLAFAAAAGRVVVVSTPEPTAMTDAYGMIKALARRAPDVRITVVVNMAASDDEARAVHARMSRVSRTFLRRDVEYGGFVPLDPAVREAVQHRVPFTLYAPEAPATISLRRLAHHLAGRPDDFDRHAGGVFARLFEWISGK